MDVKNLTSEKIIARKMQMTKRKLEVSFIEYRLQDHFPDCIVDIIHQYSKNEHNVEYWKTEISGYDHEILYAIQQIIQNQMDFAYHTIEKFVIQKRSEELSGYLDSNEVQ
jgi:uncharacterized protein Usg